MATYIPPDLAKIAGNRINLTTAEFAHVINKAEQTVRKNYCLTGECYGIRPVKIGQALNWPVTKTAELLTQGSKCNPPLGQNAEAKAGVQS